MVSRVLVNRLNEYIIIHKKNKNICSMREIYSTGPIAAQYGSLGLRSEKYIITSQHEDLVHHVLFLLDTELPGYGCWLAVDDLDGEHAGLSCCVGKRILPGKLWALLPRQTRGSHAQTACTG